MIRMRRRKTDHFGFWDDAATLVPQGLIAAGGVVDLNMRLQVVAIYVEAQRLAVVLDRLRLKAYATADKFLFVVHGRDAIEHMITRIVNIVENLFFKRQHARLVEIARTGEEILAVGVFAAERPGDKVAAVSYTHLDVYKRQEQEST